MSGLSPPIMRLAATGNVECAKGRPTAGTGGWWQDVTDTVAYIGPGSPKNGPEVVALVAESARAQGFLALDTETISLKDRYCIGAGLAAGPHACYIMRGTEAWPVVMALVSDARLTRVMHNVMFDSDVLGFGPGELLNIADTSIMAAIQGMPASLSRLTFEVLGRVIDEIQDVLPARKLMIDLPFPVTAKKCLDDVRSTHDNYLAMKGPDWESPDPHTWQDHLYRSYTVTQAMKDCYQVDLAMMPILVRMGKRGIALRPERVREHLRELDEGIHRFEDVFADEGFKASSPQQVGYVLAARGSVLPLTDSKRQLKTDEETLSELDDPLAAMILEYRGLTKLKSTYLVPWSQVDRATSHYRLDLATARLASFDRNLQNIPLEIRDIFEPDSGIWTVADANQIEMRVLAFTTKDPVMMNAYASGSDIHTETQMTLWPDSDPNDKAARRHSKIWNFAKVYLGEDKTLAKKTGSPLLVCRQHSATWEAKYSVAWGWLQSQAAMADYATSVPSMFGRKLRLPFDQLGVKVGHIRRCAANYPIQNGAIEVIKRAMLRLDRMGGCDFATQVHDEILNDGDVDIPSDLGNVVDGMPVPFEVIRGPNWEKA